MSMRIGLHAIGLKKPEFTKETIFKRQDFKVELVRKDGKQHSVIVQGKAELTELAAIDLQYALNKLTGHI